MPLIHHLYLLTIGKKRDTLTILELHYDPWVDLKIFLRVCQGYPLWKSRIDGEIQPFGLCIYVI